MSYKIDKTYFSSQFGTFQTYTTRRVPISISGTIANGKANQYQAIFTFTRDTARARVTVERNDTGLRAPFTAGNRIANLSPTYQIYQFASSETVQTDTHYESGGTVLVVNLTIINNTGGTVTLTTQQLNLLVDFYDAPIV